MPQLPFGVPSIGSPLSNQPTMGLVSDGPVITQGGGALKRAVSYAADHQGCGFWRMHWPESLINGQQLGVVNNNNFMVLQENFYIGIESVRIQRQVTSTQLQFAQWLRQLSNKTNKFKIYYEIDDVIFPDDIPLYNAARSAFVDPKICEGALEVMRLCDAITTPTEYMSKYYTEKSGIPSITLPNYMPKFWIDRYYNKAKIAENYETYKKRPRVGYIGSPTHFNLSNVEGARDDFSDISDVIIKTIKNFKWVIMGGVTKELMPYVKSGDIEYMPWARIYDYPSVYHSLNLNMAIAPLQNNKFNLAKAPIKYLEAGAFGIPCVCQNLEPYSIAPLKFDTGDEMISILKKVLSDRRHYLTESDSARKTATNYWLEDHIQEYTKLYFS